MAHKKYTRDQLEYCFRTMLAGLAVHAADTQTMELTIDMLRTYTARSFQNEVLIIEICDQLADSRGKSEQEKARDLHRMVSNYLWQVEGEKEGEKEQQ